MDESIDHIAGPTAATYSKEGQIFERDVTRRLPVRLDEVTPLWLNRILAEKYSGVVIREVELDEGTEGTASRYRLTLTYDENDPELPATMFLKSAFHDWRAHLAQTGAYESETKFYAELLPDVSVNSCKPFAAVWDSSIGEHGQFALLLDDLGARNCTFGYATRPITPAIAETTLDQLCSLHARYWQDPFLNSLDWLQTPLSFDKQAGSFKKLEPDVPTRIAQRGHVLPTEARDPDRLIAAFWKLQEISTRERRCLAHGDPHIGNFFFESDGRPGILDWQILRHACFMHDVTYHIGCSLSIEDRRNSERELLTFYLDGLAARGVEDVPTFDETWLLYRQHFMYGLWAWLINPGAMQLEETNLANLERMGAGLSDHETFAALGA